MERWYIAFNTIGAPQEILGRLLQAVRQQHLGEFVIRFCYEKGAGAGKKRGQFYVFIGVISKEKGFIPEEIHSGFHIMLQMLHLVDKGLYVYIDEVKRMVSKELEIHNLRKIKMFNFPKVNPSDPFNYTNSETTETQAKDQQSAYNDLLFWLSLYGFGTWQQFKSVCLELGLDLTGEYSRRIARRLRSLGHIEITNEGQNWFISPACLVETENTDGQFRTFLTGQRSLNLIGALEQAAYVELEPQPDCDAPEVIRVTFPSRDTAEHFVQNYTQQHQLYLAGRSDLKIASVLPDLTSWEDNLPALTIIKGNYAFEQLVENKFLQIELPKETGLYRLTHVSTRIEHPQLTLFFSSESNTWRKADWYGLRYLMIRRTGTTCMFLYDHKLKRLCISKEHRLPDIYERSLVLASGRLPIFWNEQVIFGDVSDTLAHMLSNKLEATYVEHEGV
jgi:hypothetical protein